MKNAIGDRIKSQYENRSRFLLPRRSYTIIRVDGKAFHTYTAGLQRPFDDRFMSDMNKTAEFMCKEITGAKMAFVQSDEINILLTDFETIKTQAWFDGNIQKICSVSASLATAGFNYCRTCKPSAMKNELAFFDSRVFQIPDRTEVENYFIWRQQDATTNSISAVAQSVCSNVELLGKSSNEQQDMIFKKSGKNWNDLADNYKRGRLIIKENQWKTVYCPIFSSELGRDLMKQLIPFQNA